MTSPLQLLILEGNVSDAELAVTVLERADYACTWDCVQTRTELAARLDRPGFDLILADYHLADFDGLSAFNLIRSRGIDIPFIVYSTSIGEEAVTEVLKAGATDYLMKTRLERLPLVVGRALKEQDDKRRRCHAEEALRQSERRYAAFMQNLPSVAFMKDLDGRYVYVNEAVEQLVGVAPGDWVGRTDHELWPESTARRREQSRRAVIVGGTTQMSTHTVPHPDGVRHWVNVEFPIPRVGGSPAMTGGMAIDMTESRRQETERAALLDVTTNIQGTLDVGEILERAHHRILSLLPCDRILTYRWDGTRGAFPLLAAHGVPEKLGADTASVDVIPAELVDKWIERGRPVVEGNIEEQAWIRRAWTKRLGGAAILGAPLTVRGILLGVMVAVREDSEVEFVPTTVQLFERMARHVAVAMGAADLYSAKEAEAQLNAAMVEAGSELLSGVNSPDLLNRFCQVTTRVLKCNRSYTALWEAKEQAYVPVASHGYSAEEWAALRALKIPRTQLADVLTRLEHHEMVSVSPLKGVPLATTATVATVNKSLWMALRRGRDVEGIHIAIYDTPEADLPPHYGRLGHELAQLASLALENARLVEELKQANRVKSDFVATMSHELRTPLNSILGYTDLVLEELVGPLTAEQAGMLRKVERSGRRLLELVNITLDISRLDAGVLPVNLVPTQVAELLAEIEADTREQRESNLRFVWQVPPGLPHIETDPAKLKVIVTNLISNAVKFTENGSVTVAARAHHAGIEIAVSDTGIGIAPSLASIIFEPFRQGEPPMTRRFGGVGLGLYIVRRLLDLLGGTIEVESQVGAGSTFRVWVPRAAVPRKGQALNLPFPARSVA